MSNNSWIYNWNVFIMAVKIRKWLKYYNPTIKYGHELLESESSWYQISM